MLYICFFVFSTISSSTIVIWCLCPMHSSIYFMSTIYENGIISFKFQNGGILANLIKSCFLKKIHPCMIWLNFILIISYRLVYFSACIFLKVCAPPCVPRSFSLQNKEIQWPFSTHSYACKGSEHYWESHNYVGPFLLWHISIFWLYNWKDLNDFSTETWKSVTHIFLFLFFFFWNFMFDTWGQYNIHITGSYYN